MVITTNYSKVTKMNPGPVFTKLFRIRIKIRLKFPKLMNCFWRIWTISHFLFKIT